MGDWLSDLDETNIVAWLRARTDPGFVIAADRIEALEAALRAQQAAEDADAEYLELCDRVDAEGWDEETGGSHLTSAYAPVIQLRKVADELRHAVLPHP